MKLYRKLSLGGIKQNKEVYVPYISSFILIVIMFSTILSLIFSKNYDNFYQISNLKILLSIATIIIGLFSFLFLSYSNNFVMKRRAKEFGLYNVLGLEKNQVAKVIAWDNFIIGMGSTVIGLIISALIYKLAENSLFKMMGVNLNSNFKVSIEALVISFLFFFLLTIFLTLKKTIEIKKSSTINFLKSSTKGEKSVLSEKILGLISVIFLGIGYYLALTIQDPIQALMIFLFAIISVIIGTYTGFGALSIVVLKILKKNKKYYYNKKHFVSISGLIYRIRQSSIGLSNICIMSCALIVVLGSAFALQSGKEAFIKNSYPMEFKYEVSYLNEEDKLNKLSILNNKISEAGLEKENAESFTEAILIGKSNVGELLVDREDRKFSQDSIIITVFDIDEFEEFKDIDLKDNEAIYYSSNPKDIEKFSIKNTDINISMVKKVDNFKFSKLSNSMDILDSVYIFVKDITKLSDGNLSYTEVFDLSSDKAGDKNFADNVNLTKNGSRLNYRDNASVELQYIYGAIYFIGLFLGIIFTIGTVLVIYYKQVSEGYEDVSRYSILRRVGMTEKEVKDSINSQVRTVFLLPPVVAGIHLLVAFKLLSYMLSAIGIGSMNGKIISYATIFVFYLLIYFITYKITSKTYYKIISRS